MMYGWVYERLSWLVIGLCLALLAGCGGDLNVDEFAYSCDPNAQDPCGDGYLCRPVPGQKYSACYALGDEPQDAHTDVSDADAPDLDGGSDATNTPDGDASSVDADTGDPDTGDAADSADSGDATDTADAGDGGDTADTNSCGPSETFCSGTCVDLESDPSHCGACDNPCAPRNNTEALCQSASCEYVCTGNYVDEDDDLERNGCECPRTESVETSCDGVDNDCDGEVDEGCLCTDGQTQPCGSDEGACVAGMQTCVNGNWAACNDTGPVNEACANLTDDDCDGEVDEGCTCDYQGFDAGVCAGSSVDTTDGSCIVPADYESPEATCDQLDNDCDGNIDEGLETPYYLDSDGDTFGDPDSSTDACSQPGGYVLDGSDCDDSSSTVNPGAQEQCDTIDNDCDGSVDPGCQCNAQSSNVGVCADGSWDGSGNCLAPSTYVADENNNNDDHCDMLDNDCDGVTDEGCPCNFLGDSDGVCATATRDASGNCAEPSTYESAEFGCGAANTAAAPDGLDNDCDGIVDEIMGAKISTGGSHACLVHMGTLYCWGTRMSVNGPTPRQSPYVVAHPTSGTFASVSAGTNHTCAIDTNHEAYCWGEGDSHRLGNGSQADRVNPVKVTDGSTGGIQFQSISAGGAHTCGVTTSGTPVCWGNNVVEQCGSSSSPNVTIAYPTPVSWPNTGVAIDQISAGLDFTCARTVYDEVYCWGHNDKGQLGVGTITDGGGTVVDWTATPQQVYSSGAATVDTGFAHACVTLTSNDAFCWGDDMHERLGNGTAGSSQTPVPVVGGASFKRLRVGAFNACGIGASADAGMCWGEDTYGANGDGVNSTVPEAQPVGVVDVPEFERIDVGTRFACGIGKDDNVYCWGADHDGRLGNGPNENGANRPSAVRCF